MTSIDELARRAGDELQRWNPAMVDSTTTTIVVESHRRVPSDSGESVGTV